MQLRSGRNWEMFKRLTLHFKGKLQIQEKIFHFIENTLLSAQVLYKKKTTHIYDHNSVKCFSFLFFKF